MKITWLTQGGFLLESGGTRLLIDPYRSDFLEKNHHLTRLAPFPLALEELKPDWYFCTHDHLDHLDPETVAAVAQAYPDCRFAGPASCYAHFQKMELSPALCVLAVPGEPLRCGAFELLPVAAFHSDPKAVGLLIIADGHRVYLSGDTLYQPELINPATRSADTVLICINGRLGNMNDVEALKTVEQLHPQTAIPMHYGLFAENTADPQAFLDGCRALGIRNFSMTPGKEFTL